MTLFEFILKSPNEMKQICIDNGITSRHDFVGCGDTALNDLCKQLNVEKDNCTYYYGINRGSYTEVNLDFNISTFTHVINPINSYPSNGIKFLVKGTNPKTLSITAASFSNNCVYIWNQPLDFFSTKPDKGNLAIRIWVEDKSVKSVLEKYNAEIEGYEKSVDWFLNTLTNGEYVEAYNSMNENVFKQGSKIDEYVEFYIKLHKDAIEKFNYDLTISEAMLLIKYYLYNKCNLLDLIKNKTFDELQNILSEYKAKYVKSDLGKKNQYKLMRAQQDIDLGIIELIENVSKKYGIHKSYFNLSSSYAVRRPAYINIDLSEPFNFKK